MLDFHVSDGSDRFLEFLRAEAVVPDKQHTPGNVHLRRLYALDVELETRTAIDRLRQARNDAGQLQVAAFPAGIQAVGQARMSGNPGPGETERGAENDARKDRDRDW